jgi:hypothetical protein
MLVKVAITIGSTQRLVLPQRALVSRAEVNAVYVLDKNQWGQTRLIFSMASDKVGFSQL